MQQSLRRPANWQDFEELCKRLWGEIWECPEIARHGRLGQNQHGVDIFGIPAGKDNYYGIQCKGKDEYTDQQFTEKEIDEEIEKAKSFDPPLEMYYLATTAVKDAKIEAHVRRKNIELRKVGLFGVALFSWEDIVDLIDTNKRTHDYYVRGQKYEALKSADVTFSNGLTEITLQPQFEKNVTIYRRKPMSAATLPEGYPLSGLAATMAAINKLQESVKGISYSPPPRTKYNLSYVKFNMVIYNSGIDSLEDYKVRFHFEGNVQDVNYDNIHEKASTIMAAVQFIGPKNRDVILYKDKLSGVFLPHRTRLVGRDSYTSDDIYIKVPPKEVDIILHWELLAKEYNIQGTLLIHINPVTNDITQEVWTSDPSLLDTRYVEEGIKDRIVEEEPEE